jgi:hypothetical protein
VHCICHGFGRTWGRLWSVLRQSDTCFRSDALRPDDPPTAALITIECPLHTYLETLVQCDMCCSLFAICRSPCSPFIRHVSFAICSPFRHLPFAICHSPFAVRHSPFAVRHSPFAIRRSPFAIRRSPFVIRHSPFAIRHSPFAICHSPRRSPFAIRHSPFAIRHSPFAIRRSSLFAIRLCSCLHSLPSHCLRLSPPCLRLHHAEAFFGGAAMSGHTNRPWQIAIHTIERI